MAGKECVAIGSDLRFGVQFQTLATDFQKVYKIHDQLYLGLGGLATDTQTLCVSHFFRVAEPQHLYILSCLAHRYQRLLFKHNMYKLREERSIKPSTFAELLSSTLYEKRSPNFCILLVITILLALSCWNTQPSLGVYRRCGGQCPPHCKAGTLTQRRTHCKSTADSYSRCV